MSLSQKAWYYQFTRRTVRLRDLEEADRVHNIGVRCGRRRNYTVKTHSTVLPVAEQSDAI